MSVHCVPGRAGRQGRDFLQSPQELRWNTCATYDLGVYFCMWEARRLKKTKTQANKQTKKPKPNLVGDRGGQIPRDTEGEHEVAKRERGTLEAEVRVWERVKTGLGPPAQLQ